MPRDFPRPLARPGGHFDQMSGASDPAEVSRMAHATASALIDRVRTSGDDTVERVVRLAQQNGLDDIAELWAHMPPSTLPGVLWRLYVVHESLHADPALAALMFERGNGILPSIDPVVAGAERPTGPLQVADLIDTVLRGAFTGEFDAALDRAAASCRVVAAGAVSLADEVDLTDPDRASALTSRADRLARVAVELTVAARLWRSGRLH